MYKDFYKFGIKVVSTHPHLSPISNINNSYLYTPNSLNSYFLRVAIKETLPISIFLALSTVNKVSYKLYRRGLFE